ncbi:LysR family transcriptional regulator [Spirillospora sp. CA-255316]
MNLASLDLNLVVALRALLEERNVTRAGRRVGLSQPAMSGALARLRRHFDDDVGGHYELTALGQVLLDRTSTVCDQLERLFTSQADFDPATESREFTLGVSDYSVAVFGAELTRILDRETPRIRVRFVQIPAGITEMTGAVLSTLDGVVMPHGIISDFPATELYEDGWVFLVAEDNPEVGDRLSRDDLARLPWVTYLRAYDSPAVHQLGMLGIEPRVSVSGPPRRCWRLRSLVLSRPGSLCRVTGGTLPRTRAGECSRNRNVSFRCCTTPPIPSWRASRP